MYRIATGIILGWIGLVCAAQAAVDFSAPAGIGSIDTLPPRIEVLTPGENQLYLRLGEIHFSWQVTETHSGSAVQGQVAEVMVDGTPEASHELTPGAGFGEWTWIPADGPAAFPRLRVTATDSFGNRAQAFGHPFTLLPAGSAADGDAPRTTRLAGARPNPFNPSTSLHFELAEAGAVRLEIFDLRGRRVRTLLDRPLGAGAHAIDWDGTDDRARPLSGGTYLIRLEAVRGDGRTLQTRKAVLLP